ncbi:hypothetical protein P5V15_012861 [Pogonomyrmex californicus]
MLHRIAAGNYVKASDDQRMIQGQCVFRVVGGRGSASDRKAYGSGIVVPALYDSVIINLQDITFPMTLDQIKKFERINDISIDVYNFEGGKEILPIRLTDKKMEKHANLLCLHYFSSSEKLQSHTTDCKKIKNCADCRARTTSGSNSRTTRIRNDFHSSFTRTWSAYYGERNQQRGKTHRTSTSSTRYLASDTTRCSYDNALSVYRFRRGENCVAWFVRQLEDLAYQVKILLSANVPIGNVVERAVGGIS